LIHLITMSTYNLQVKLRGSSPDCTHCGENSVFTEEDFQKFDYESFTQSPMSDKVM
jgi:adenylyltransferase and sulfurtransferase